MNTQYQ
ncbi:Protein of unknown function [Bacillus thuringiensis]|nr:Protein of unknown function [Bacillus thuringiensis]